MSTQLFVILGYFPGIIFFNVFFSIFLICQLLMSVIKFLQLKSDKVECAFLGLDVNKGPGLNGITRAILKRLASIFKFPLTVVFNLSLSTGVFPAIWKESFVVPLFKSSNKRDVSSYQGISMLSAILKLFQKMVCVRITPVVRPIISDTQYGFVKGRSTVSN
jgi:hypothetical protein